MEQTIVDSLVKKSLIRTMICSLGPNHWILEAEEPRLLPLLPDVGPVQLAAPTAAEDRRAVIGMVAHEMEVLA